MQKHNEEKVKNDFKQKGIDVLDTYKSYKQPMLCEKDGYKFYMSYKTLVNGEKPKLFGAKCKFQLENIKLFFQRNFPNIEVIDVENTHKSGKHRTFVIMKCECGDTFKKEWSHIFNDKHLLCNKCQKKITVKNRKVKYDKKFLKILEKNGFRPLEERDNYYANELIEVEEISTGYRGFTQLSRIRKKILVFSSQRNLKNYVYNINQIIKNNGDNSEAIFVKDDNNIIMKCGICGKEYNTTIHRIHSLNFFCQNCTANCSQLELKVENYLKKNEIEFIREFTINSCRDKNPLPFDFWLKDYNVFIEVDGLQHFEPVRFGGMTQAEAKAKFIIQQSHDKIKNEYCKKYNIPLLRIPYYEFENNRYKEILKSFIKSVQE